MLFSLLTVWLCGALVRGATKSNSKSPSPQKNPKENVTCSGKNHILVQDYYNNTDIDLVCGMYGLRPAQITFSNFQEVLDDLSDCVVGGKNRQAAASSSSPKPEPDNTAWVGGIEGYGGCVTLNLLGPLNWAISCDNIQHMVICQSWDMAVYETLTSTSTVCPTPPPSSTTSFRTHITVEFTGRLELDVWQVGKKVTPPTARSNKAPEAESACGANGILILTNSTGYLDSRTACQNTSSDLAQLDLTNDNYPLLQQIIGACLKTEEESLWVNSFNGLGIANSGNNAPCGYVKVSLGGPELVLLADEGTCHFIPHLVACQAAPPVMTTVGPIPISATTHITSYEVVTVTASSCK